MKVLAVEDLQTDRLIIKRQLGLEFDVNAIASFSDDNVVAKTGAFDIALINLMLQYDLDGLRLLTKLKEINGTGFLAIATTCYIDKSRYDIVMRSGFDALMLKPFCLNTFLKLVIVKKKILQPNLILTH